ERRRALKVMHAHFADSVDFRERFKREARVAAQIDSDYIVDVFDAGVDDETKTPFLVMELLRGEEVSRTLRRIDRMSPPEVVSCLHQTALALDRTHKAGIVHRDLKPENLFLCERDDGPPQIKVLDFGIAKFATSAKGVGQTTNNVGTPLYMAPEQFQPGTEVTAAADIYAIALLAYTLLVGIDYWHEELERDDNVFAFALIAMKGPIETASTRALRVAGIALSPAFDTWFRRVTSMMPEARYTTASEAVRELAKALGVQLPAPNPTAASLQGLGSDVLPSDLLIPDPVHNSRATPAGSATTMEFVAPTTGQRWKVVAVGGSVLVAAIGAWFLMTRNPAPSAPSAPVAAVAAPTPPPLVVEPAPQVEAIAPGASAEAKSAESPEAHAAPPKARPKSPKAAASAPKAPPKPIYSRD
ncbi:MAG: serine/threonine-protein kinase, partial [Polyangiaceae bacterium]